MINKEMVNYVLRKQATTLDLCRFCKKNYHFHPNVKCEMLERMCKANKILEESRMPAEERCKKVEEILGENPFKNKYIRVSQEILVTCKCDEYEGELALEEVEKLSKRKLVLIMGEESHKDEILNHIKIEQNKGNNVFVQFVIPYEDESTITNNRDLILEYIYKMLLVDEYIFVGYKKDDDDDISRSDPTLIKYCIDLIRNHNR